MAPSSNRVIEFFLFFSFTVLIGDLDFETERDYSMKIEIIDEHDEVAVVEFNILVLDINEKPSITFKDISHVPELSSQGFLVGSIVVCLFPFFISFCKFVRVLFLQEFFL